MRGVPRRCRARRRTSAAPPRRRPLPQVGDRYVVEEMRKHGYNLGGEQSGHLIFLDHASTGDGIVAALQVLAIMVRTGRPLSELAKEAMERVPQVLENVTLSARQPLEQMRNLSMGTA